MVGENHTQAVEGEGKISYHNNSVHAVWEWEPGNEARVCTITIQLFSLVWGMLEPHSQGSHVQFTI